jgi:hypothetical protein
MFLLAIDPGSVNLGWVVRDVKTGDVLDAGVENLTIDTSSDKVKNLLQDAKATTSTALIVQNASDWARKWAMLGRQLVVCIEQQYWMPHRGQALWNDLAVFFAIWGVLAPVTFVFNGNAVKSALKLRGNGKGQSKQPTIDFAFKHLKGTPRFDSLARNRQVHACDAYAISEYFMKCQTELLQQVCARNGSTSEADEQESTERRRTTESDGCDTESGSPPPSDLTA